MGLNPTKRHKGILKVTIDHDNAPSSRAWQSFPLSGEGGRADILVRCFVNRPTVVNLALQAQFSNDEFLYARAYY